MSQHEAFLSLDYRIKRSILLLLRMAVLAAFVGLVYYARPAVRFALDVLSPFIVALIVAYIFNPLVTFFQRRLYLRRLKGVVVTYFIILLITVSFFAILVPILYIQLRATVNDVIAGAPKVAERVVNRMNVKMPNSDFVRISNALQTHKWDELTSAPSPTMRYIASRAGDAATGITKFVGTAIGLTIGFFAFVTFVVVISFYFLLDYGKIQTIVRVLLPDEREPRFFDIWHKIDHALGGLLRGQLIVAVIVGTLYSIALMILGMKPYAILIGFVAGFGNLIPYFGPVAGGVPAGLWVLFGDRFPDVEGKFIGIIIVILIGVAIQTFDGFFLQPRIVGRSAELHPLLVLLALIIGANFGMGGLILAVPTAVVVRVLIKELWWDPLVARERAKSPQPQSESG